MIKHDSPSYSSTNNNSQSHHRPSSPFQRQANVSSFKSAAPASSATSTSTGDWYHPMYQQQQQQQTLPGLRASFSGQGGTAPGAGSASHSNPYSSYSHNTYSHGAPPLPSPASSNQGGPAQSGGHAHPGHSPLAPDMAAWGNTQGGVRPHTADAYFGNGYNGFNAQTQQALPPPSQPQGPAARQSGPSYGPGSNRVFAYMPSTDDSPGAEGAYAAHPSSAGGPGASPYGASYTTGSSTPYTSSTAPNTATSTAPSSAGTGATSSASAHKKRPRRRYDEIERLYRCNWPGCTKSYGTLNHLNAHVAMQKHGAKRLPTEFKDMRRAWRKAKKDDENRRNSSAHVQIKTDEDVFRGSRMGSLPNPGAFYPNVAPGGMYPPPSRSYGAYPHPPPAQLPTESGYPGPPTSAGSSGSGSGSGTGGGGGGHMLPPFPGRSNSVGTAAGYGMHPTGMAASSAAANHDHYGNGGSHGYPSHGWSQTQSGGGGSGPHHHHQQQQQQSSAPTSSAGPGGPSGLGAYLMAHRGSI
ncbi:hypothetical protein A4X13_0g5995 [Tilletia indica]|uniref:Uncharacterized protein n=1 Tax=Tilletia indica TaxID=43049 RepID=A0A177TXN0_9BASI|nr:hypothetical protein A4X13_0g5995 [Tilletia indica]